MYQKEILKRIFLLLHLTHWDSCIVLEMHNRKQEKSGDSQYVGLDNISEVTLIWFSIHSRSLVNVAVLMDDDHPVFKCLQSVVCRTSPYRVSCDVLVKSETLNIPLGAKEKNGEGAFGYGKPFTHCSAIIIWWHWISLPKRWYVLGRCLLLVEHQRLWRTTTSLSVATIII